MYHSLCNLTDGLNVIWGGKKNHKKTKNKNLPEKQCKYFNMHSWNPRVCINELQSQQIVVEIPLEEILLKFYSTTE